MAEVEERLGKLEIQMTRVQEDITEIKSDQRTFIREIRAGFESQQTQSHALEIAVAEHLAIQGRNVAAERSELSEQGAGIAETLRRMPGATFLGRHGSRIERYFILGILAYLLKIVTIDIDLPRLNKVVGTYETLSKAGAIDGPAGVH